MAKTNWGAGLSALGQGLAGLAQMQYQRQLAEQERAQQLADVESQRQFLIDQQKIAREQDLADNPFVTVPEIPWLGGAGGGPGMSALAGLGIPSGTKMRQDKWFDLSAQAARMRPDEKAPERMVPFQFGPDVGGPYAGQTLQIPESDFPYMANAFYGPRGSGGSGQPSNAAITALIASQVSPQETALRGTGYQTAVRDKFYELAEGGMGYSQATAAEAERQVMQGGQYNSLSFGGLYDNDPASVAAMRYDPATDQFYDSRYYAPRENSALFGLIDKPPTLEMREDVPFSVRAQGAKMPAVPGWEFARSKILPLMKKETGFINPDDFPDLIKWATSIGATKAQLDAWLGQARTEMALDPGMAPAAGPFQTPGYSQPQDGGDEDFNFDELKSLGQ